MQVIMVGEGTVSTPGDEFGGSLSPEGSTLYFDRSVPPHYLYGMFESRRVNGRWSKPQLLPFSGQYRDSDPVLSPDGRKLLFVSDRLVNGIDNHNFDIYMCTWTGNAWSDPVNLGPPINGPKTEYFASMAANGNLYLTAELPNDPDEVDVFVSRLVDGRYTTPQNLGPEINAEGVVTLEAFISPDESFLLMGSFGRPDSLGSSDIYASYNDHGSWGRPIHLGPLVNTVARDYSPRLTPDGKYLIFTSERGMPTEKRQRPWTMADFEREAHSVLNGLGNIYEVPVDAVLPRR